MSTNNYINQLVKAFNISKDIIKEAKRVPVIITNEAPLKHSKKEVEILESEFLPQITIYSISMEKYCSSKYLHLSGVNVLFYIVCLYFISNNIKGTYYKYQTSMQKSEEVKLLRNNNFIFNKEENGFEYFEVSQLKSTTYFKFDLPQLFKDGK